MVSRKGFLASVRARIASGEWKPGAKLPSTSALAKEYGVSESMVNQAMAVLADTGEVRTVPGDARYVGVRRTPNGAGG